MSSERSQNVRRTPRSVGAFLSFGDLSGGCSICLFMELSRVKIVSIVKGPRGFQLSFHSAKAEYSIKECSKNTHLGVD